VANPWLAWPAGSDPAELSRSISVAHEEFVSSGSADAGVRAVVAQSWQRCLRDGVDPEHALAPLHLAGPDLASHRDTHPLARVMPVIRRLLVDDATDAGLLVAVTDAAGRLLWVEGDSALRSRAEAMHFAPGANWSEAFAGINAPGTALALDHAVQIFAAEHLSRAVTPWSCSAAPIHDPDTGAILGAVDLTGGDAVASPNTLSLVRATVAAVESELRLLSLTGHPWTGQPASGGTLSVLGRHSGLLRHAHGQTRLSLRHSELLTLLAAAPDGMTADDLGIRLHEHESALVTVRAEMSRLRRLLAGLRLESRPYRLVDPVVTDADQVRDHLRRGRLARAVELYKGPMLPASQAPGIATLRDRLHAELRTALLGSGDADALLRFADTDHGRFDHAIWSAAARVLAARSPRRDQVLTHLRLLDSELGV
jgi:transcriptional regulator of acetoin/glycerol metabolism